MGINRKIPTKITESEYAWFTVEDFDIDRTSAETALRITCDAMIGGYYFYYNVGIRGGILTIADMILNRAKQVV